MVRYRLTLKGDWTQEIIGEVTANLPKLVIPDMLQMEDQLQHANDTIDELKAWITKWTGSDNSKKVLGGSGGNAAASKDGASAIGGGSGGAPATIGGSAGNGSGGITAGQSSAPTPPLAGSTQSATKSSGGSAVRLAVLSSMSTVALDQYLICGYYELNTEIVVSVIIERRCDGNLL